MHKPGSPHVLSTATVLSGVLDTAGPIVLAVTGSRQQLGRDGEELAVATLRAAGMNVMARNWRCRYGEIDIIAQDLGQGEPTVVFCEVKCRSGSGFGTPFESITDEKVRRLRRLAGVWLLENGAAAKIRLDAIGVILKRGYAPRVTHLRGIG